KIQLEDVLGGWCNKNVEPQASYADPLPPSMQGLNMDEFYEVDIDWRMLTTARPKTRTEEEIFSKLVDMGRLQLQRIRQEAERRADGKDWRGRVVKVVPGRGSVPEVRLPCCKECGEELCQGLCKDYMYQNYARVVIEAKKDDEESDDVVDTTEKKKVKKKKGRKRRKKKKKEVDVAEDEDADDEEE
ncbi:unnamed protein product, partial [Meganyctiphanes norvegica]